MVEKLELCYPAGSELVKVRLFVRLEEIRLAAGLIKLGYVLLEVVDSEKALWRGRGEYA